MPSAAQQGRPSHAQRNCLLPGASQCAEPGCRRWKLEQELQQGQLTEAERKEVVNLLERRERDFTRLQRQRMSAADFEPLTLIGRGAFGEVLTASAAVEWLIQLTVLERILSQWQYPGRLQSRCPHGCSYSVPVEFRPNKPNGDQKLFWRRC